MLQNLKAVIPAAGKGVRLSELTKNHPKPMLKFNGKPLLEHTLNSIKKAGIKNVVLIVGYKGEEVINYFLDGSRLGLNISYAIDERISGTATAIKAAENMIESTFLVSFGDVYPEPSLLESLIKKHLASKRRMGEKLVATLALTKVDDPFNHAPISFKNDEVLEIWSESSDWVDMGIMMLEPIIFKAIKETPKVRGEYRILKSLEILMNRGYKVMAHPTRSPWIQIGDHSGAMSLIIANNYFLQRNRLDNYVEDSIISDSRLSRTSIMKSEIINSKLENCIVYDNAKVVSSELKNCVVVEGAHIENMREVGKIIT